jgi:4-amino-4-deoxychorismate lyase
VRPLALAVLGRGVVDPDEPVLTVDDVALTRGQAAFETLRVYNGVAFALPEHLDRLAQSAARLELPPVDRDALTQLAALALAAAARTLDAASLTAATPDLALRFYWTGGREGEGRATGICLVSPVPAGFDELRQRGLRAVSLDLGVDVVSRARSPWLLGGVKSTSYAVNIAARSEALRRGADDALLLAADGTVLEGATSNVWWRSGDALRTPALELGILAGVTRTHLLVLGAELGYAIEEGSWPLTELLAADEVLLSSSLREVVPVVSVDGQPIGAGVPGTAAASLQTGLRTLAAGAGR